MIGCKGVSMLVDLLRIVWSTTIGLDIRLGPAQYFHWPIG